MGALPAGDTVGLDVGAAVVGVTGAAVGVLIDVSTH